MKIAIPSVNDVLSPHFGHCQEFVFFSINAEGTDITAKEVLTPPPHEPGVLPKWVADQGGTHVICGGMGARAQQMFESNGVSVVIGAPALATETIIASYLEGNLVTGANMCDH